MAVTGAQVVVWSRDLASAPAHTYGAFLAPQLHSFYNIYKLLLHRP